MDFNNKKKKRRTRSVQDMYGIGVETRPTQKSSGGGTRTMSYSNYSYKGNDTVPAGGMGLVIFGALLALAIIISCVVYMLSANKEPFEYPVNIVTINGILTDIYSPDTATASSLTGDMAATDPSITTDPAAADAAGTTGMTTGADTAALTGSTSTYPEATSHEELLTQIDNALSLGDKAFITNKLLCKDTSGNFIGYSVETIDAFVAYMSGNPDKRSAFITSVADAATYSTVTQDIYYLSIPKIVATIEVGYADTTVSMTSFQDTIVDGVTPLELGPLLPMDYTFTISNAAWPEPVSQVVPVGLDKTNIPIKVK